MRFESETAWLTQAHLVELYQSSKANITMHIKNILEEGELTVNPIGFDKSTGCIVEI